MGKTRSMIRQTPAREGFSLLEVLIGTALATTSILGLGVVFISSQRSHDMGIEETVVSHAFRRTVEQMRGERFEDVETLYTGYQFTVDEVNASGTVTVYVDETASVPELGLPRDLNGDGDDTDPDVSPDYNLLPVRVDITWSNMFGGQTRTLYTYLSEES